jgi:hypothetical protein
MLVFAAAITGAARSAIELAHAKRARTAAKSSLAEPEWDGAESSARGVYHDFGGQAGVSSGHAPAVVINHLDDFT